FLGQGDAPWRSGWNGRRGDSLNALSHESPLHSEGDYMQSLTIFSHCRGVGRGRGSTRDLGVGVALGVGLCLGVAVGVGVAVGIGVPVGLGVGVEAGPCTSNEPMSIRPSTTRSKPGPRWSKEGGGVKAGSPALTAGLPGNNPCVKVGPPLSCNGPSIGSV